SRASLAGGLRRVGDAMTLSVASAQVEVRAAEAAGAGQVRRALNAFQVFQVIDRGNKGFVDLKKVNDPRLQSLRGLFEMADRDGDGRVTRQEFTDFAGLQGEAVNCSLTLGVSELGQGLFEILDANRDGRLSVRELRSAWQTLSAYDHNK